MDYFYLRNRLVSSGSLDKTLKVWDTNIDTLTHLKTLLGHNWIVVKVISLSKDIITFGSHDKTIRIWDVNKYKEIQTLREDFYMCSLLKLKNKDEMVAGGYVMVYHSGTQRHLKRNIQLQIVNVILIV